MRDASQAMNDTPPLRPHPGERSPNDPAADSLSAAIKAFHAGHWATAVAFFEQAREEGIAFTGEAWDAFGTSLYKSDCTREAARAFEQAVAALSREGSEEAIRK